MEEIRTDNGLIPDAITPQQILASLSEEGRHEAGIFPPIYLAHYSQRFAEEASVDVAALLNEEEVSAETVDLLRMLMPYGLLNVLKGAIDFGYAARVLEERAVLPPFESNTRFTGAEPTA